MANGTECETCDRIFVNYHAACQHRDALGHWECDCCWETFCDEEDAEDHMEDSDHRIERYCFDCDRGFQNVNNYQQHRNSKLQRGTEVKCPYCKTAYVTASGLSHHLESGSCSQARNVNRETIFNTLRQRDTGGIVTNNLIKWHGDATYTVTANAWNGAFFECYLCHSAFRTLESLGQHINSPRHAAKLYHCPKNSCNRPFVSLAALFNHLESESCGYARFDQVQRNVNNFLAGGRMLTFR